MPDNPVLVVGAGPTGLVLAIELARRGVPFHLLDRHSEPLRWDRATTVKARSLEVFGSMGLADSFVRRGRIVRGVNFFSGEVKVASYTFDGLDSPFPFMLSIPEDESERILTEKLEELGGRVERGVEFAGLEQGERSVRARLRSLHDGERTLEASWVVGTDGLHSAVRDAIGDQFDGHDEPTPWGVVDAHLCGWRHPADLAAAQLEPPMLYPIPLPKGRWRVYFRPDPNEDVLATVGARLRAISPGAALEDADKPQLFHTHSRVARRYRIGRVLLAGDAAHACSPFEGHGMNTGIQDAHNLGWKLGLVVSGAAAETLLDSYEVERQPIAQAVARSGDAAEARVTEQDPAARQALITLLASPEGRQFAAVAGAEIAFGYDQSPIVDEVMSPPRSAARGTQVGSRVGDAAPLTGRNHTFHLHELIGVPGHTLLLAVGHADPAEIDEGLALARAAIRRYRPHLQAYVVTRNAVPPGDDVPSELLRDPTGALHERLGADRPSLYLVRPDGHLGFCGEPPYLEALEAHLRRIFLKFSTRSGGGSSAVPAYT
jgi:2-polyprenyl-6-methoxyphenol hydroxylase-like FAD-dependent oxidoreductase